MKKLFLFLFMTLLIVSCGDNSNDIYNTNDSETEKTSDSETEESYEKSIVGVWRLTKTQRINNNDKVVSEEKKEEYCRFFSSGDFSYGKREDGQNVSYVNFGKGKWSISSKYLTIYDADSGEKTYCVICILNSKEMVLDIINDNYTERGYFSYDGASCEETVSELPDYEPETTAYFAYQFPVRTLVLGNDIYDNSLDNAHKCQIWSTMGGAYNGRNAVVEIAIDNSLCDNLYFTDEGGNQAGAVLPMPESYYKLSSLSIPYNGDVRGNVEVQFTDAFFNDLKSIENTYVIPLIMKNVSGIGNILTGTPREGLNPARTNLADWDVLAKDYVLYCVKYINPWDARYIRRGVDVITENGKVTTVVRKDMSFVNLDPDRYTGNPVNANDEVCAIKTINMKQAIFPVSIKKSNNDTSMNCDLILTFEGNKCKITSKEGSSATISGEGEFIEKGTSLAAYKDYQWGSMNGMPVDRDILRLSYKVNFGGSLSVESKDTLVVQTRDSNKKVFFSPKYVK